MSSILRLRSHLCNGLWRKSILLPAIVPLPVNLNGVPRYNSQPALKEEDEEEEVDIDQRLVDEMSGLTMVEAAEVGSILLKKMGMKEPPVVGMMRPGAAGMTGMAMKGPASKEEKKPEKTVFELKLESYEAASKIKVIKEVRSFTDLGLKEAKDLVEKTPSVLKKGVSKEECEQIIEKMKTIGAKVVME